MSFFEELETRAHEAGLEFLVIGGLAVNIYGVSRDTADLDLLVCRDQQVAWCDLLRRLGYSILRETRAFIQFSPPAEGAWPVDFMLVESPSFKAMAAAARSVSIYGAEVKVPAIEHLLALKLHALKYSHLGRFLKDYLDVENLVRANRVNLHSEEIRALFLKHGNADLYEKVKRSCSAAGAE